jgi:RNA polymerase sigma-70 factor (ECF subfamily)
MPDTGANDDAGPPSAVPASSLVEGFFRHEAGRLTAMLVQMVGPANLALAEDVVQDVLCQALETWKYGRLPQNPSGWLVQAARNRAVDLLRHRAVRRRLEPALARELDARAPDAPEGALPSEIGDEELRMMFSCCAPGLPIEAQVALVLKTLCGFGVREIAHAMLASVAAVEKQISRGKAALRKQPALFDVAGPDVAARIDAVHEALYLLFSEGYHGSHPETAVRVDLCREALRLAGLLAGHAAGDRPATHALVALMCFDAARVAARLDDAGGLVLLEDQDRARWDRALIAEGFRRLGASATGPEVGAFHLEAGIAAKHAAAPSLAETDWVGILALYDMLAKVRPSPIVALNRAIALAQVAGPEAGLEALAALAKEPRLGEYPFYEAARGELYRRAGQRDAAARHLRRAIALARNPAEANLLTTKVRACEGVN